MNKLFPKHLLFLALIQAIIATFGSLFFSLVLKLNPCTLCWYQRICMYPLVVILTVAIIKRDKNVHLYVLPFSIIGLIFAFYHSLLVYGLLFESKLNCLPGTSCATMPITWFGFITIPLLSFIAFLVITTSIIFYQSTLNHAPVKTLI